MEKKKNIYEIKGDLNTGMSFAILARADRLLKHRHAWKVWHALKEFGCKVYLVAPDLDKFEGSRVFSDLKSLEGKVDVVVPCLRKEYLNELIDDTAGINARYIWFQEKNWTLEFEKECQEKGILVLRGCVLKHKTYKKPLAWINPCYWHGKQEKQVPNKYQRLSFKK